MKIDEWIKQLEKTYKIIDDIINTHGANIEELGYLLRKSDLLESKIEGWKACERYKKNKI